MTLSRPINMQLKELFCIFQQNNTIHNYIISYALCHNLLYKLDFIQLVNVNSNFVFSGRSTIISTTIGRYINVVIQE